MVKHNNVIPNIHCHKKWHTSTRGPLKVKLNLNQASKKKSRRLARAAKAAAIAPRPLQKLRPIVYCPTQKYSYKQRLGRGFTLEEVRAAGLTPRYARTVGIAVDHRRYNHSQESMDRNVERLKAYKAKLVVFPRRRAVIKNGDSSVEETSAATQFTGGVILPIEKAAKVIEMVKVDDVKGETSAFTTMRVARKETKVAGFRCSVANRKKD
mmetsp:Transcript_48241/g.58393  ORF Transcript_48241/g.58393 Transcript_48241/m.58393 type:complete len:210 (-) Transcript_48241:73-702(-)|eukprot:CAMPEP_0172493146 /NCGR_PEP_ID=MMETSP1066-20121228/24495_1 /TAXON_ID=671091 /ORGANISM="Coscinodiscus wailesii, Strain CCMP2513" /LENGTH=209 /DNA_ID=CAMNT_0013263153 /DNA_START=95 /DNA_END=724 /DNA_ORIENTATION=-